MTHIVTFGTFDLFHVGHLRVLQRAAAMGTRLSVGVSSDALNFSKKERYPAVSEEARMEIVRALDCVDHVFLEESLELKRTYLRVLGADMLVMGDDWAGRFNEFEDVCRVVYLSRTPGISTTELTARIQKSSADGVAVK